MTLIPSFHLKPTSRYSKHSKVTSPVCPYICKRKLCYTISFSPSTHDKNPLFSLCTKFRQKITTGKVDSHFPTQPISATRLLHNSKLFATALYLINMYVNVSESMYVCLWFWVLYTFCHMNGLWGRSFRPSLFSLCSFMGNILFSRSQNGFRDGMR